ERFQELSEARRNSLGLLLALRRAELLSAQQRHQKERAEAETRLEQVLAAQRSAETEREHALQALEAEQATMQSVQAGLFQTNTDIARQEAEDRAHSQNRDRATAAQTAADEGLTQLERERIALQSEQDSLAKALRENEQQLAAQLAQRDQAQGAIRPLEAELEEIALQNTESRALLAASEAEIRSLQSRLQEALGQENRLKARLAEMRSQATQLEKLDPSALSQIQQQRAEALRLAEMAGADHRSFLEQVSSREPQLLQDRAQASDRAREADRLEAEHAAQTDWLSKAQAKDQLVPWIAAQGLSDHSRLWQTLRVAPGFQRAVESVLLERMGSLGLDNLVATVGDFSELPPARMVFFDTTVSPPAAAPGSDALAGKIQGDSSAAVMARRWLSGFRTATGLQAALRARQELAEGEFWVTPEGHWVGRYETRFYAADQETAGLLEHRDAVEDLDKRSRAARLVAQEAQSALARSEESLAGLRRQMASARDTETKARQRLHELELSVVRLQEKAERLRAKEQEFALAQRGVEEELTQLASRQSLFQEQLSAAQAAIEEVRSQSQQSQQRLESTQSRLTQARQNLAQRDHSLQEMRLQDRTLQERRARLEMTLSGQAQRRQELTDRVAQAQAEIDQAQQALAASPLQRLLADRLQREAALTDARNAVESCQEHLREKDEARQRAVREAEPLRARLSHLEAAVAGAEAALAQLMQQVEESGLAVDSLIAQWPEGRPPAETAKPAVLQAEINRLQRDIEALGPVNLAALSELEQARERLGFLESQVQDLSEAVSTLEDAIRKIDRESRALLQSTYDTVNENFGRLFPTLFGGGEARLVLTGDEILDSGVQVMAQPPGKKNTTIHLLSGGEKALTATALVFALFQLNPAPFCLLDEVDAPLDDPNTERLCTLIRQMSAQTQFIFITHNKISMELAEHLVGVTMQEQGVSRLVAVDLDMAGSLVRDAA
ncbi:MAG: AAA family ATPase, partial [Burkholderiaceae bacterium]